MNEPQVISVSRRSDVVMHYAPWFVQAVLSGNADVIQPFGRGVRCVSLLPQQVHTVVLWSKDYGALLRNEAGLYTALSRYEQLYCHLTVTGLGGSTLEPAIAPAREVLAQLPSLVALVGDPRRVSLRYDPIVHWYQGDRIESNLQAAEAIIRAASAAGLESIRTSFATLYGKVRRRKGWRWYDPPLERRLEIVRRLVALAHSAGVTLYACSQLALTEAGALPSRCIDGELLTQLHPRHLPLPTTKDPGQRPECGCTPSIDIGSYSMSCANGCRYCYANPKFP